MSTVRCRMGNGSGAVLARRVDGAQLECASAARGLGAALSANALAAAAAQYERPGARPSAEQLVAWRVVRRVDDAMACRREHSILGGAGCCVGPARANRCGAVWPPPVRAPVALSERVCCLLMFLSRKMRCERCLLYTSPSPRD